MTLLPWNVLADTIAASVQPVGGVEQILLRHAAGRMTAEPVLAMRPLPAYSHAVMDGYALGSAPPKRYTVKAAPVDRLAPDEAMVIAAGAPVPAGTSGVALSHRVETEGEKIRVSQTLRKDNLRHVGEEAQIGDTIVAQNTRFDARQIALSTAAGVEAIAVKKRPRIALVGVNTAGANLPHVTVLSSLLNSSSLMLTEAGTVQMPLLASLLQELSAHHELIVVVAESLGDEEGVLTQAIMGIGGMATVHRAALKPAKPIIFGNVAGTPIIGLAGTAYATTIAAHLFVRPVLLRLLGRDAEVPGDPAVSAFVRTREQGRAEALPVLAQKRGGTLHLTLAGRFGQLRALAEMDGFALVEVEARTINPGTAVSYMPLLLPLV